MPSPKYPLKPLVEHRERAAEERTVELAGAMKAREAAEDARARAEQTRESALRAAAAVREEERSRLARGELSVADLARGQAWEIGAQARLGELTRAVDAATQREGEAKAAETGARATLAGALADRDVVAKDEVRFRALHAKKVLAAEEEQAEEAFGSRDRTRGARG